VFLKTISEFNKFKKAKSIKSIGLVPTMGALHQGHLSLIRNAFGDCDCVVVSIFVNPTQFNNTNDLSNYPRTLTQDIESIKSIDERVYVYAPSVKEIYPDGVQSNYYNFGELSKYMEGEFRQGHFNGVGTVLQRLFELVKPDRAYFGEKDYQQLAVVQKLVKLTGQQVDIIGCPTYRENNGLAKSSRNKLLSEEEKLKAGIIYEQLELAKNLFGSKSISEIKNMVSKAFKISKDFKLEYIEIASVHDLIPAEFIKPNKKYRAFIAVYCNDVRLIDNLALN
jgi:pantoate--beta-alanine ligase